MKTRVSSKGRVVLPVELRRNDGVVEGQTFEVARLGPGIYQLKRCTVPNEGVVDWLLTCAAKGFFRPIASELTSTIKG
jgi:hypothetical protein